MRFFVFILLINIFFASNANEENTFGDIWLDGNALHGSISAAQKQTIYFANWDSSIDQIRNQKTHYIALQLDRAFDPLPFDTISLPSLSAVASISSEEVLDKYLLFLEQFSRTNGINYLILPDTTELSLDEIKLISTASERSPQFYIPKEFLTYQLPETKKEFLSTISNQPQIWVASPIDNLRKVKKWNQQYKSEEQKTFLNELVSARDSKFLPVYDLPSALKTAILHSGIYAMDDMYSLPLTAKEVVYLGTNDQLKQWLSKYATVYTQRKEHVITIVDHLSNPAVGVRPGDILLTLDQQPQREIAQLVLPFNAPDLEILMCKMLFGAATIKGKNQHARFIPNHHFLSFSLPTSEGLNDQFFSQIDSIGVHAISNFATPGFQVAVVKNGSMVYEKSFGYFTYDSLKPIDNSTIYDVASLTKVMATLPAIAWCLDKKLLELDDSISHYLPEFIGSNKSRVTIRQLLAHNAGLKSYMPFWSMMMDGDRMDAFYYKTPEDEENDIRTYGFEPDPMMMDTLRSFIVQSDLIRNPEKYNYSDLGFMILHLLIERISQRPFDEMLKEEFYEPMGLKNTTFNPVENGFGQESIAPTEYDQRFRNYQVWGEVHDRNAAVFGGVSGHAGLFSNALDLAKMMSMFLNGGYFGGKKYLSKETLDQFNIRYFQNNRRGLGWDKKDGKVDAGSKYASDESFGHTGFTGTMVWADPREDLIFVFLSNRIYPDANNNRLSRYNTRTLMHDSIYESIILDHSLKLND